MTQIEVKKIIKALNASDGAGVKLKRSIGTPEADYIEKQEFVNQDLNKLMKSYKDNQDAKQMHYQEELRDKKK